MNVSFVDLAGQYAGLKNEIEPAIREVLESGVYILGRQVARFEQEIAAFTGTRYGIGVASGTDALHLALLACGIGPGDEVITTPFTFVATAEVIKHCGARPVFVDIEPGTCNIDPAKIERAVTEKTRAIIPVHLYGRPCHMDPITDIAGRYGLTVIEDCAQSLGAQYRGKKTGSIGDAGCLSFFPSKNLGAFGDGGMVVTNDRGIAEKIKILRAHGSSKPYQYVADGFNSRLDELQAAVLRVKLVHLDEWIRMRRERASMYDRLLSGIRGIELPDRDAGHAFNYYTIYVSGGGYSRDQLSDYLAGKGIKTMVYYPRALHLQLPYRDYVRPGELYGASELRQDTVLSLPIYPELEKDAIEYVAGTITDFALSGTGS